MCADPHCNLAHPSPLDAHKLVAAGPMPDGGARPSVAVGEHTNAPACPSCLSLPVKRGDPRSPRSSSNSTGPPHGKGCAAGVMLRSLAVRAARRVSLEGLLRSMQAREGPAPAADAALCPSPTLSRAAGHRPGGAAAAVLCRGCRGHADHRVGRAVRPGVQRRGQARACHPAQHIRRHLAEAGRHGQGGGPRALHGQRSRRGCSQGSWVERAARGAQAAAGVGPCSYSAHRPASFCPLQAQEAINWQDWNKEIDPKLVQQFKQAYESEWLAGWLAKAAGWLAHRPCSLQCGTDCTCLARQAALADLLRCSAVCVCAAMKLPKYEGSDLADATAQFAALMKEADALVASSQTRMQEIKVGACTASCTQEGSRGSVGHCCGCQLAPSGQLDTAAADDGLAAGRWITAWPLAAPCPCPCPLSSTVCVCRLRL